MNAHEMLDFALGQADPAVRQRIERQSAADAALAERLGRLDRAVRSLLDDGGDDAYAPPPGLAAMTVARVREASARRRTILDFRPVRLPFRPADLAVAAGVLLAGMLTLLPAVHRTRDQMDQAACASNLQKLGRALWIYGARHQHFPFGPDFDPGGHAGAFAVALSEDGLLADRSILDCPHNGPCDSHPPLPGTAELAEVRRRDPARYREILCTDYAYNVSFARPSGRVEPIEARCDAAIPLLADQPPHDANDALLILPGNSPNHGGRGQNVLYSDLHVRWHNTRRIGPHRDDLFLNADRLPGPGLHERDHVLCPPLVPFAGAAAPGR